MGRIPLLLRFEGGTREASSIDSCWREKEEEEEEVTFFINVTGESDESGNDGGNCWIIVKHIWIIFFVVIIYIYDK